MGTSIWRRASENGEHGAPDRGQCRRGRPLADSFSPTRLGEAAALQEGVGDHRHERVAVHATPGSAFEVVEAEFLFQLLSQIHRALMVAAKVRRLVAAGRLAR